MQESSLASAAGLAAVVLGVLVLGAVLHSRVPDEVSPAPEADDDVPAAAEASAAPAPTPPTAREAVDLRAAADAARLAEDRSSFTLQALVACQPATVQAAMARAHPAGGETFVLPAEVEGAPCWRVVWGRFPSADAARLAALPDELRPTEGTTAPVRRIGDLLP